MVKGKRIGLALSSGAARGWSQIGLLEVLDEAGFKPDVICGTSMGAIVGAASACGRLAALKEWALAVDWRTVTGMVDINLSHGGLVEGGHVVDWLGSLDLVANVEDTPVPFGAVATDITTGGEVWLRSGPMGSTLRASISMPGIFSPVQVDGQWLVDGGLVNPIPVSLCRAMGADIIIAVNLNEDLLGRHPAGMPHEPPALVPPPLKNMIDLLGSLPWALNRQMTGINLFGGETPGYFEVLTNAIYIMQDHITRSRLAGEPPHVLLSPRVADLGLMDFHHAAAFIEAGRSAAELALPLIESKF